MNGQSAKCTRRACVVAAAGLDSALNAFALVIELLTILGVRV